MKGKSRLLVRIVAVVILVAVFGWQYWQRRHPAPPAAAPVAASAGDAATPPGTRAQPAPPARLRMGSLTLTACALKQPDSAQTTPAYCARFKVPENRADPRGRSIALALAIVKSSSAVPDRDLVTYLAGGPGQSAIQTYPSIAPGLAPLLQHHDLLLVDQRGTGDSHPLECPKVEASQAQKFVASDLPPAEITAQIAACAKEVEQTADPRAYTTSAAVADLEAVRQALGAPRLDLVGVSYGTRVAQHYASAYPTAVRSIVLDGVVPNQLVLGETFATALERSLKLQETACRATPACERAFGNWYATLQQLDAKLKQAKPRQVTFPDPATFKPVTRTLDADTLAGVVRLFSYSAGTQALLPLAVNEAAHGNYAPLLGQSKLITSDLAASMGTGMQLSVICAEDAPLLTPRPQDADLMLGDTIITNMQASCAGWPHAAMPAHFHAAFQSAIPTLLISGERDPVTPPADAAEVLKGLSDGRSLVVRGLGHAEAINAGCMPRLVEQFIDKLQPQRLDAKCLDRIGPIPAFINYNGAAP
ncbi:MAG TPA: alpha/beta fold hydrolase [Rhodanobacteraceae bacterium]|nr:alpha/beta fold hydrolase [Rhodanobacteraceae bacterium]